METKNCKNCKKDFNIEQEDFSFYEKIGVPAPTLCPECRQQRRYAWRNERTLYRRPCDLCGKSTVTIYSPNKPFKVYCVPCWWSDGWDTTSYGVDFDFSRPFFEQFSELQHNAPRMALLTKNSVKSEYTNHCGDNKNVYLSFSCFGNENIFYSTWVMNSRDCFDCTYIYEKGERLYECIDSRSSYKTQYSILMKDCSGCYYCYDCHGSSDCFISSNLRNKSYVFRNEQLTREKYLEKMKEIDLGSYAVRQTLEEECAKMLQSHAIHKYVIGERNVLSTGNALFNCKNIHNAFDVDRSEDTKYIIGCLDVKDSMDTYHVGINTSLCYELQGCTRVNDVKFCHLCYDDGSLMYCDSCQNSTNLFGCVSVKKGEYMIFNKHYSKEEYLALKEKIITHMKSTGEYGEFFPPSIAPVAYNETQGSYYLPLTKEEVESKGWQWEDNTGGSFGKETIALNDIPDNISEVSESSLKEVYKCATCSKNYNIVLDELNFYKRENVPLPRNCPECRYKRRFALRLPRKLWQRKCMNEGCQNEFESAYSPDRLEIVYCESCYQQNVV